MTSIRHRVLFCLCLAGIVPLAIILLIISTLTSRAIKQDQSNQSAEVTKQVATKIEAIISSADQALNTLATNPTIRNPEIPEEEKKIEFERITKFNTQFTEIVLYSDKGFFITSNEGDENLKSRDQTSHWNRAMAGEKLMAPPQITESSSLTSDDPVLEIPFYIPVLDPGGRTLYIIQARFDFNLIWEALDAARLGNTGRFVLIDEHDNILYHRDHKKAFEKYREEIGYDTWLTQPEGEIQDNYYVSTSVHSGSGQPWALLGLKKKYEANALIRQTIGHAMLAAAVTILVAILLGFWLTRVLSDPVTELSKATRMVAKGQLLTSIPESGPEEMRNLARDFNYMASEVEKHQSDLEFLVEERTRNLLESQSKLADTTAQLRATYESTQEAILVVKTDGEILAANRRFSSMFGIGDVEKLDLEKLTAQMRVCFGAENRHVEHWERCNDSLSLVTEDEWVVEAPKALCVSVYSAPVKNYNGLSFARLWMFRDLTEQRILEQGLRQAQKMEAIGRLAGGVAHDFNNLLTGIIGNLSLVEMEKSISPEQLNRLVSSAKGAGQRAAELVKQLLGFSRQSHLRLECCAVNDIAEEVKELLVHTIDPSIQIKLDLAEDLWPVSADPNQIQQVLMNMAVNAKDAIGQKGRICISTRNLVIDEFHATLVNDAKPGDYARISVEDTGEGMSADIKSKIFEPFFTTKEQGKGTGLGLATSYGIIQQHGGWIACDSEVGAGTTFHIFLPKMDRPIMETPVVAESAVEPVRGGDETVLLVDDELVVRLVGERILAHHGYRVLTANDGEQALDLLDQHPGAIDVVLLDMTMPKLSGKETFGMMRKGIHGQIPVIVCSGYVVDLDLFMGETGSKPEGFVQKPYDSDDLVRMVRRVIDEAAAVKPDAV